jgi:hypothetical protein
LRKYNVAVLLPTRARTDSFTRSVASMIDLAHDLSAIEFVIAIDSDDVIGHQHFSDVIQPLLDRKNVCYTAVEFESLGYAGLNRYYNELAKLSNADWLFVWNDDAVMNSRHWDQTIASYTGQFRLLKVHTHKEHPYSIFPIVPRAWFELMGHLSRHQMIDAELSQIAFCLDLMQVIDVDVTHDQSELTGQADDTSKRKIRFEGNPNNAYDFHNTKVSVQRNRDCDTINQHLKSLGLDGSWWERVKTGEQYPWEKLIALDVNRQMKQFSTRIDQSGQVVSQGPDLRAEELRKTHGK